MGLSGPVTLTPDQRAAIDGILIDIQEPGARVLLCGYAGTGKTVTTAALVTELKRLCYNIAVATPTHKARVQVERALTERGASGFLCATLHSLLGLKQQINYKTGEVSFVADRGSKNMLNDPRIVYNRETGQEEEKDPIDIVVVDETSMVGRFLYEALIAEMGDRPIVFVGDDRQLLPVKEDSACPAFVDAHSVYRLDDVLRHDGAILNLATDTRRLAVGRAPFKSAFSGGSSVVAHNRRSQWINALIEEMTSSFAVDDPDYCRALAWINRDVQALNTMIHIARYGKDAPRFVEGMICVSVDAIPCPHGGRPLFNSTTDVLIESVEIEDFLAPHDETDVQPWKTWSLVAMAPGHWKSQEVRIIHEDDADRWKDSQKKIAEQAKQCQDAAERRAFWDMYWERSNQFGKLEPATALTIHKSQGSTFQNVFLHWDVDGFGSAPTAQQNQLAYVGITRAARSLHVVSDHCNRSNQ